MQERGANKSPTREAGGKVSIQDAVSTFASQPARIGGANIHASRPLLWQCMRHSVSASMVEMITPVFRSHLFPDQPEPHNYLFADAPLCSLWLLCVTHSRWFEECLRLGQYAMELASACCSRSAIVRSSRRTRNYLLHLSYLGTALSIFLQARHRSSTKGLI